MHRQRHAQISVAKALQLAMHSSSRKVKTKKPCAPQQPSRAPAHMSPARMAAHIYIYIYNTYIHIYTFAHPCCLCVVFFACLRMWMSLLLCMSLLCVLMAIWGSDNAICDIRNHCRCLLRMGFALNNQDLQGAPQPGKPKTQSASTTTNEKQRIRNCLAALHAVSQQQKGGMNKTNVNGKP